MLAFGVKKENLDHLFGNLPKNLGPLNLFQFYFILSLINVKKLITDN